MNQQTCSHLRTADSSQVSKLPTSYEALKCVDCDSLGPNLWLCLFKNCMHVGCSEKAHDHSSVHNMKNPSHCIQMNLLTHRVWCYECMNEIFLEPLTFYNVEINDHSYEKYFNSNVNGDCCELSEEECSDCCSNKSLGLQGLQNVGNTCYMNAALQALSNTVPLTKFFLECATIVQILSEGRKPALTRIYQGLMKDLWVRQKSQLSPNSILCGIRSVSPTFRGYAQHDTQEFLRNFVDQLHEELKQIDGFNLLPENIVDEPILNTFYESSEEEQEPEPVPVPVPVQAQEQEDDDEEEEYETCDSGVSERSSLSDEAERNSKRRLSRSASAGRRLRSKLFDYQTGSSNKPIKYRSIISDIFDGKLLSSVQCLTCDRVSSCIETFQDLSLPIPSRDHLVVLHGRSNSITNECTINSEINCSKAVIAVNDSWIAWILNWLKLWLYGPIITLHDCLAAFFSTDELKGDNMYSCERCNKLRNGIKYSKVLQLPEVLCIHLKRFRHEVMYSSKISSVVSFPLKGLDMRPYLHKECVSKVTTYELFSIICHYGTVGNGHYICYAMNGDHWYEYDDQMVTRVYPEKIQNSEGYVLFYRKYSSQTDEAREKVRKLCNSSTKSSAKDVCFVSKQWLNRFNTCTEPGPIDNSDFLCQHGYVNPDRELVFKQLTVPLPVTVYDYLYKKFGGCASLKTLHICPICEAFNKRLLYEMETFLRLSKEAQTMDLPRNYLISISWYTQWHQFVGRNAQEAPGPIDNTKINLNHIDINECVEVTEDIWRFLYNVYGGGPEIKTKPRMMIEENEEMAAKIVSCAGEPMEMEVVEDEAEGIDGRQEEGEKNKEEDEAEAKQRRVSVDSPTVSKRHRRRRKAVHNM